MSDVVGRTPQSEVVLHVVPIDHPRAREMENKHIAEMAARYGGRGPGPLHPDELEPPAGLFVVAFLDRTAVGCGGFRALAPDVAEIKRMYVDTAVRGGGIGRQILGFLEARAAAAGYAETWLETGSEQPEAISLYLSAGYRPCHPYGEFKDDPRSRCFSRTLAG
jgi:GNAT superfamily N-acetyltransferase